MAVKWLNRLNVLVFIHRCFYKKDGNITQRDITIFLFHFELIIH